MERSLNCPMLLILTSRKDLAADYLIVELAERGLPYFRLNAEDLSDASGTFVLDDGVTQRTISVGPHTVNLSEISAVWYRRAIQPEPPKVSSVGEKRFVAGELRHLMTGLTLDPSIKWVNAIDKVYVAEHKVLQLRIAKRLGFNVPRTLISDNADDLRHFTTSNDAGTICKPVFHGLFTDAGNHFAVYTRRVTPDSFNDASLKACPVFLQEEIPRGVDVRATFVGDQCFVAEIETPKKTIDWRDPDVVAQYSRAMLSKHEEQLCRAMLEELDLSYGAFDFIRAPDDKLFFLEINPTGEWAWLEESLAFPIRNAFIELLFGEENE